MRHLHFVQSVEPMQGGGLGSSTLQLHEALVAEGGSHVITTRDSSFSRQWTGVFQGKRRGPDAIYYSPELLAHAEASIKKADWVHAHGLYVYPNALLGSQCRRQQKPYAYHIHGFFDPWILARSRFKKWLVNRLFESRNLREASFIRALTVKERQQITSYGLKQPVVVIPNGIDLSEVDRPLETQEELGVETKTPETRPPKRLLFLSRIHPKKGLDILIQAWASLAEQFPDWELAIVGPDEGGYLREVVALIQRLSIQDRCLILGSVSGNEKRMVFQSADVFVLPSYSEGFPMVALEAMAHRLPVVLTTECNFAEALDADAGWGCEPEQESLSMSIKDALSASDEERSQRGMLGRKLVEDCYSWERIANALVEACETYA